MKLSPNLAHIIRVFVNKCDEPTFFAYFRVEANVPRVWLPWPDRYILPEFPDNITNQLNQLREAFKANEDASNNVVRILKEDMARFFPQDAM